MWPTYGPNGLAMTWPTQVLRRPFVGGFQGKPKQYFFRLVSTRVIFGEKRSLTKVMFTTVGFYFIHGERLASLVGHRIEQDPQIPIVKVGDTSI